MARVIVLPGCGTISFGSKTHVSTTIFNHDCVKAAVASLWEFLFPFVAPYTRFKLIAVIPLGFTLNS